MDYVYKLNLPKFEEVVISLDDIVSLVDSNFSGSKIFYPDVKNIFRPCWLTYKNLEWDYVSLFLRSGNQNSMIHQDNPLSPDKLHWGINWVYGKESIMEYWEETDIVEKRIIKDVGGKETVLLEINSLPSKIYSMKEGVYLVNASKPHRVKNLSTDLRLALSLRSKKFRIENPLANWSDIIEMFKDDILRG